MMLLLQAAALAAAACAPPWAAQRPSMVVLRLSAGPAAHSDVPLTLEVRNVGSTVLRIWLVKPSMDFDLEVRDAKDRTIEPSGPRELGLPAHHAIYLQPQSAQSESALLRTWGYRLAPGTYRIKAYLRAADRHAIGSNALTVTLR